VVASSSSNDQKTALNDESGYKGRLRLISAPGRSGLLHESPALEVRITVDISREWTSRVFKSLPELEYGMAR
jgi:hypothetical protein